MMRVHEPAPAPATLPPQVDIAGSTVKWCESCEREGGFIIRFAPDGEAFQVCWDCLPTVVRFAPS